MFAPEVGRQTSNRIVELCKWWSKLRDKTTSCERALIADRANMAILDTGASKTVVGKGNFVSSVKELAPQACVPFGRDSWIRSEVVNGRTPFLISNAFMRKLQCHLDFEKGCLKIPKWQKEITLEIDSKGPYPVDVGELTSECNQTAYQVSDIESSEGQSVEPLTPPTPKSHEPQAPLSTTSLSRTPSTDHGLRPRHDSRGPRGSGEATGLKRASILETYNLDPGYGRYILNRHLSSKSLLSFRSHMDQR